MQYKLATKWNRLQPAKSIEMSIADWLIDDEVKNPLWWDEAKEWERERRNNFCARNKQKVASRAVKTRMEICLSKPEDCNWRWTLRLINDVMRATKRNWDAIRVKFLLAANEVLLLCRLHSRRLAVNDLLITENLTRQKITTTSSSVVGATFVRTRSWTLVKSIRRIDERVVDRLAAPHGSDNSISESVRACRRSPSSTTNVMRCTHVSNSCSPSGWIKLTESSVIL